MSAMKNNSKRRASSLVPWLVGITTSFFFSANLPPSSGLRLLQEYTNAGSPIPQTVERLDEGSSQRYSYRQVRRLDDDQRTSSSTSSTSSSSSANSSPASNTTPSPRTPASTPTPTPRASTPFPKTQDSTPSPTPRASASSPGPLDNKGEASTPPTATPSPVDDTVVEDRTTTPSPTPNHSAGEEAADDPTPNPTVMARTTSSDEAVGPEGDDDGSNKVATPYFADDSTFYILSVNLHIKCATKGAIIRYTLDGTDPAPGGEDGEDGSPTAREVPAGGSEFVNQIGTITIRAVAMKEGMHVSDEISKTVTVQDRVEDPVLHFDGESADDDVDDSDYGDDDDEGPHAFLRSVMITMDCSTPNATIRYTTDGSSPDEEAASAVPPGSQLEWSEEGITKFTVSATADELYVSEVISRTVKIVAPRTDEHPLADASSLDGVDDTGEDMLPRVEVTAFKAVYAAPGTELEQQEELGPGYGGECEGGARIVTGKLLRVFNPSRHVSFAAPSGACGGDGDGGNLTVALAPAAETAEAFEQVRETVELMDGESPEEARVRLNLDAREKAWRAAGGDGCQAVAPGGLLGGGGAEGKAGGEGGGSCVVGHLVSGGRVIRAEKNSGLVSFGIRGGNFVVGVITEEEVKSTTNPFQELISGAGWLVRAGVNHIEASARDGHLDVLRGDGGGLEEKEEEGLDDVLTAKLARTAIGHDAEGRLILLQTEGAAAGADQDTAIPDGLDLSELANVLVEAGAHNAVNLVAGSPAAMTINGSAVAGPAEACFNGSDGGGGDGGFTEINSILPRCERPVSSVVCVHLDPPPIVPGDVSGGDLSSDAAESSLSWENGGDDWGAGGGSSSGEGDDDQEKLRLQWAQELCANTNGTGNGTDLWRHLDDVEEALFRFKIAFWVAAGLGMISLFFNIQPKKWNLPNQGGHVSNGDTPYSNRVGLAKGDVVATPGVEMQGMERSGKRGSSRKGGGSSRRKGSSIKAGAYAPVNGDVDWNGSGGFHGVPGMDSEEEVDLGLRQPPPPTRGCASSGRRKDKSKSKSTSTSRLRRALTKVAKGDGGGGALPTSRAEEGEDMDATMPINPFGGRGGAVDYDEEGAWA